MKAGYYVAQYGYHYPNPEGVTLTQARAELVACLKDAKAECRRTYKCGTIHRLTKDSGSVTLGRDKRSQLWTAFSIQACR